MKVFCLGLPRTGPELIWQMASRGWKSSDTIQAAEYCESIMSGEPKRVERFLERRQFLGIEVDCSHLHGYALETILKMHPSAKFILTTRECYGWLNHFIEYCKKCPDYLNIFWHWLYSTPGDYHPEELILKHHGMHKVDSYISEWANYHDRVINLIPPHRLLIIKWVDLNSSLGKIANFLNIKEDSLRLCHDEQLRTCSLFNKVNTTYVREKIRSLSMDVGRRIGY
jgi:hypothetical protein